jgi:hypothetical protein
MLKKFARVFSALIIVLTVGWFTRNAIVNAAGNCGLPRPDQVIIYSEKNGRGSCKVLTIDKVSMKGTYCNAGDFGLPDDSIYSIDVGADVRAVLYQKKNQPTGCPKVLYDDDVDSDRQAFFEGGFSYPDLGNRAGGETSSIEVFKKEGGPAAINYEGNYPRDRAAFWSNDPQGLANDGQNWFVTTNSQIFKVPFTYDLGAPCFIGTQLELSDGTFICAPTLVPHIRAGISSSDSDAGYDHIGDPDQSSGFLFVPLNNSSGSPGRIAVYRTTDLRHLSSADLPGIEDASWVAIRPSTGALWVSTHDPVKPLVAFVIDWQQLRGTGKLVLHSPTRFPLLDQDGAPLDQVVRDRCWRFGFTWCQAADLFEECWSRIPDRDKSGPPFAWQCLALRDPVTVFINHAQGGVFNPEGRLLYVSTGPCDSTGYIYVFAIDAKTGTARLQARSGNAYGVFDFENHASTLGYCTGDEGEGIDWVDVRGRNVYNIPEGQLHLVMANNPHVPFLDSYSVYVKHYSNSSLPIPATPASPRRGLLPPLPQSE